MSEEGQKPHDTETPSDAKPAAVKQTYNHIPEDHGLFGVHVSRFTAEVTEHYLRDLFMTVGKVHVCKVVSTKNQAGVADDKKSYIAFVKFKLEQEALQAIEKFDGHQAKSCILCVRPAYQSARFMARKDGGHSEERGHDAQAHDNNMKEGKFDKQSRESSQHSSVSSISPNTKREHNEQPDSRSSGGFPSTDIQLTLPPTEAICSTTNDSGVVNPCEENGGNGYSKSSYRSVKSQHTPSFSNLSNGNEESNQQQLQENGYGEDSHGESLPQSTESVDPAANTASNGCSNYNQENGTGRVSHPIHSPHIQKSHPSNERGQKVENLKSKDSPGQSVNSHQNYSKPGRHQNWRHESSSSGNAGNKGKEHPKQTTNSRWESSLSRQCYQTVDSAQPVTDYRLRDGLLDKKHVANFNPTPSDEKPGLLLGVADMRRGEQGFQQGPAHLQTSSPYVRSQQHSTPPMTGNVDPNTQTWSQQAQAPAHISSSYNYSQAQTAASESYPYYQSEALPRNGGQNVPPSNSVPGKPGASYSPTPYYNAPSGFAPCPQMQGGFASGLNCDTVSPLNSAMSQLTIPRPIPSSSLAQSSKDLSLWSPQEVADYVCGTECSGQASFFVEQDIDGQALLLLETGVLLHFMKAGPALKLLQVIDRLRKSRSTSPGLHDLRSGMNGW